MIPWPTTRRVSATVLSAQAGGFVGIAGGTGVGGRPGGRKAGFRAVGRH